VVYPGWASCGTGTAVMDTLTFFNNVLSVTVIFAAFWYSCNDGDSLLLRERLQDVLQAMLEVEQQHSVGEVRIAVGYGACKDIFVQGSDLMGVMTPPQRTAHFNRIDSMKQLKEMYALFYTAGSAADLRRRTSDRHTSSSRVRGDETESDEDIHLIIEYKAGESWGTYQAPRANRFIIHSDDNNPVLSTVEDFGGQLEAFKPNLFVVGGLQMMDNFPFPPGVQEERLQAVRDQMTSLSTSSRIHFEMASFTDTDLLTGLIQHVIPYADSLGMNEQELPNLYNMMKYGNVSLVSDFNPRVAVVLDQMREIFQQLRAAPEEGGRRRLTRLHLHTLAYQVIMVWKDSAWTNTLAAATKAALTANRHVCGKPEINLDNARMLMDEGFTLSKANGAGRVIFNTQQPVSCWIEDDGKVEVCIAPVLVCTSVRHTAGGGDNISAAGLVLQV
ncbi:hypothetical protein OTU49_006000, partial [Cherax quadricarinatus]